MPNDVQLRQLQEHIQVLEWEQVELINVPVPEFENGDPAEIVHDFRRVRLPQAQPTNFLSVPRFTVELLIVCVCVCLFVCVSLRQRYFLTGSDYQSDSTLLLG